MYNFVTATCFQTYKRWENDWKGHWCNRVTQSSWNKISYRGITLFELLWFYSHISNNVVIKLHGNTWTFVYIQILYFNIHKNYSRQLFLEKMEKSLHGLQRMSQQNWSLDVFYVKSDFFWKKEYVTTYAAFIIVIFAPYVAHLICWI